MDERMKMLKEYRGNKTVLVAAAASLVIPPQRAEVGRDNRKHRRFDTAEIL